MSIADASSMGLEFVPECKTETNCDYLNIYSAPGRNDANLLKKY